MFSLFNDFDIADLEDKDMSIINNVKQRIGSTVYKRFNPLNLEHPLDQNRYTDLEQLDINLRR